MEDASLEDFLDGGGDEPSTDPAEGADDGKSEAQTGDTEPTEADATVGDDPETAEDQARPADPPVSPDDIEGATATAAWSPDGAPCADCGETVGRRWQSEAGLVCSNCKEW